MLSIEYYCDAAERTNAAIDGSVRELAGVSRLGIVKKKRNK